MNTKWRVAAKRIAWTILCLVIIALILVAIHGIKQLMHLDESETISVFVSVVEAIGLIITVIIAVFQINESKEIARATFISELNKSYIENPEYISIYNYLQKCVDGQCPYKSQCELSNKCYMGESQPEGGGFLKSAVSNYLTFFETIYVLNKKGVLGIDVIDDLFAYRFFLAVHSKFFQQEKLLVQPENFINIFRLEKEWIEYRKRVGKDADLTNQTVFNQLLLKEEVEKKYNSEYYKKLVNSYY